MTQEISDSELDLLAGDAGLSLDEEPAPAAPGPAPRGLGFFGNLPVKVTLEVASAEIPLRDLLEVDVDSVIMLDRQAGEPLDVKVNGALLAKAEVVVMNGNYGLRILELNRASLDALSR